MSIRILCQGVELPSSPVALQVLKPATSEALTYGGRTITSTSNSNYQSYDDKNDNDYMDYYPPPDIGQVSFSGLSEPCSIGSIVEVVINAHGDSSSGSVLVEAVSPSGRLKKCQVLKKGSVFAATFTPNEVGEWQIGIMYDGDHIRGSPFSCKVYDANLIEVHGLDVGLVGQELKFTVDASQAGEGYPKVLFFSVIQMHEFLI
ncbi:unnamed protein product [Gongylonema pulchrum]|uniref:Filamin-A n=1 Tax=Gongylonema pulchrum TaxID=637853 RepID=A0A183CY44_9BILA|nr:unnamed protein product [Gongylonema pulchrum]